MPFHVREARIAKMHAGRDAKNKAVAREVGPEARVTVTSWRKRKAKIIHEAIFKWRAIARTIARLAAVYPVPDGYDLITLEEVADIYCLKRCRITGADVTPWGAAGSVWWQPAPIPFDPKLGMSSGNVAAACVRGHQLLKGLPPLDHERPALERFLAANASVEISPTRPLPNMRSSCPLGYLPPAILADLKHMERQERSSADAELQALFGPRKFDPSDEHHIVSLS
jgi:hypothetical protein